MTVSYLIWNASPEIFTIGWLTLRWYGLLFALGFLITQQILYYMFRKEGKPEADVDTLTIYMVVATILGARLGHVFFYSPQLLWTDPLGVLLPFEFSPEFKFTGLQGLASHGAAVGILFALWLYSNYAITFSKIVEGDSMGTKKTKRGIFFQKRVKPGQSYIQTLDHIVILVTLAGAMIRLGNFFNAEIIGNPTDGPMGVVFTSRVTELFTRADGSPVDFVKISRDTEKAEGANGRKPINIYLFFKSGTTESQARSYITNEAKFYLARSDDYVYEPMSNEINYQILEDKPGIWAARISTLGIARHAAQLYESISCVLLFIFLFWLWAKKKADTEPGLIFGWFMVILWTLRFLYEFLKKSQEAFEDNLPINMGQILSIPLIIVGIFILIWARKNRKVPGSL